MHIGIDFDNTLVCYDDTFLKAAIARGLLPASFEGGKRAIRDAIRRLPDGNWEWTKLQAYIYGPGIVDATPFPGLMAFIDAARSAGARLSVVSHKGRFAAAAPEGPDLRVAAFDWLLERGIIAPSRIAESSVYFEDSIDAKLERIKSLACTHFIDDLEEVLSNPGFPASVKPVLFEGSHDWKRIGVELLGAQV